MDITEYAFVYPDARRCINTTTKIEEILKRGITFIDRNEAVAGILDMNP